MQAERRAGRWSVQQARRLQLEFVRTRWKAVGQVVAMLSALVAILAVVSPEAFRPYVVGAGVASVFWYVVVMVVVMAGTGSYLLGSYGEQWTSDALRKLTRHGWRLIEHVPLQYGDIDHVLLGPGGAYAIETKNSSRRWELGDPDRRLVEAIDQARGCANRLRKLLLEHSVRIRTDVRPLVVLWGTASATQSKFDGVQVVHGSALAEWKDSLGTGVLTPEQIETAFEWLSHFVAMRDTAIQKEHGQLPMLVQLGPLAILSRMYLFVVGFLSSLIGIAVALRTLGDILLIPVLLVSLAAGIYARRYSTTRYLASGWVTASIVSSIAFVALVMLTVTGWV